MTRAIFLAFVLLVVVLVFPQVVGLLLLVLLVAIVAVPLSRAATGLERFHIPRPAGAPLEANYERSERSPPPARAPHGDGVISGSQ